MIVQRASPAPSASPAAPCPRCGKLMVLRIVRQGPCAGWQFWGCLGYPECKCTWPAE
ncbi:MAG: topoisomerase DNA-binding C4 zinc finger domain-containing protein [Candidatus Sumerlaeota bacterium]|nr:topoisomerase DNA-binding C4 zinc finger domain-containing protein [Candidatus Sumerlaeota bacterium]